MSQSATRKTKNGAAGLESVARRFMEFPGRFGRHLLIHGNDSGGHARHCLSGLLGCARRKSIGRIGEDVAASHSALGSWPKGDYQGVQQFVGVSPWDPGGQSGDRHPPREHGLPVHAHVRPRPRRE